MKNKLRALFAPLLKYLQQRLWLYGFLSQSAYDADYWTIPLPEQKPKKQKKTGTAPLDDKVFVPGAAFEAKPVEGEENAIELLNLKHKKTELAKTLTKADIEALQLKGLDMTSDDALAKAAEIKKLLLSGMTIGDVVDHYKGKRGYGRDTISKYSAAFNAAMPY